jgi:hypothetical protein
MFGLLTPALSDTDAPVAVDDDVEAPLLLDPACNVPCCETFAEPVAGEFV